MSKRSLSYPGALALALLTLPALLEAQFCWRDSYGRGVGTIPNVCGAGQELDAGLCYSTCKAGFDGVGPVCWGECPAGYVNDGAGCRKPAPYGRGAGYPWKFGDPAFKSSGQFERCEADHGKGNCELNGAVVYPKCKAGFHNVGCCTCSPNCPAGFTDSGVTCTKPSYPRGAGKVPTACPGGKVNDAGLCYETCRTDFSGAGPVCWGKCPPDMPVNCGAGCAATTADCAAAVTDQVVSVLDVAVTIATTVLTAGTGTAAKAAATTGARAAAKQAVVKGVSKAAVKESVKKLAKEAGQSLAESQVENLAMMAVGEEFDPYTLDPTGIASVVKAYNKPICGKKQTN